MSTLWFDPDVQPGDIYFVDPLDVEVDESIYNSPVWPTSDQIKAMAISLITKGQRVPVECRRFGDGGLRVTRGVTRTAAAWLIRKGFSYFDTETNHEVTIKDRDFRLKVLISDPEGVGLRPVIVPSTEITKPIHVGWVVPSLSFWTRS